MVAISFGSFACREAILVGFGSVDPKSLGSPFDAVSISASAVLGVDGNFISETFNKTGQQLLTYFSKEKSVFFAQVGSTQLRAIGVSRTREAWHNPRRQESMTVRGVSDREMGTHSCYS